MNNPFHKPETSSQGHDNTLQRSLNGQYSFNIKSILSRSHEVLKANLAVMLPACVLLVAAVIVLFLTMALSLNIENMEQIPRSKQFLIDIIGMLLLAPLVAGILMLGVNSARNRPVAVLDLFRYLPLLLPLALAQFIIATFMQLGMALLILPGLYVCLATSFTLPLIADKGYTVSQALLLSVRVVNKYLLNFVAVFAVFVVLFTLCALTLGIALIWVMPFFYTTLGVLYNDLFGSDTNDITSDNQSNESRFNA